MNKKQKILVGVFCIINAIIMMFVSIMLVRSPFVRDDEKSLIRYSSYARTFLLGLKNKPASKDILFIDVAYDNELVNIHDENGLPLGNTPITNRKKLTKLFKMMNAKPENHKYILCNIFFKDTSPYDSILKYELKHMKNIVIPYHVKEGKVTKTLFDINKGVADYRMASDGFVKYNLSKKNKKSLPLVMYEDIYKKKMEQQGFFYNIDGKTVLNTFVANFRVRQPDIDKKVYPKVNLGELLKLPVNKIHEMTKGRIIIIDNFSTEKKHNTIYGGMSGGLIMLNVYLALENFENAIGIGFFVALFILYAGISLLVFYPLRKKKKNSVLDQAQVFKFVLGWASFMLLLSIITVLTYFIFNIHISVLYLSVYLYALQKIVVYLYKKYNVEG